MHFRSQRAGAGSSEATSGSGSDDSDGVSPGRSGRYPSIVAGDGGPAQGDHAEDERPDGPRPTSVITRFPKQHQPQLDHLTGDNPLPGFLLAFFSVCRNKKRAEALDLHIHMAERTGSA